MFASEAKVGHILSLLIIKYSGPQSLSFIFYNRAPSSYFPMEIGAQKSGVNYDILLPLNCLLFLTQNLRNLMSSPLIHDSVAG